MRCLVLASGFGTRLYPVTADRAKALLDYGGKPLLTHIINRIPLSLDVSICVNRKFESDFRRWQSSIDRRVEICVEDVWTEAQAKGAVGSLAYWVEQKHIDEELLVLAGDNYFEFNLSKFIAAYNGRNALVAVHDIGDKRKATQFGVVRLQGGKIIEFQEKPTNPSSSLVATACYIFPRRIFPLLQRFCAWGKKDNLGEFIAYLVSQDEVYAYLFAERWFDIASLYSNLNLKH